MTITVAKSRLPLIVRVAAAAILVAASLAACGSAASTSRPRAQASTPGGAKTPGGANPTVAGATVDPVLAGAAAKLNGLDSYKYSLSLKGGSYASLIGCSGRTGTVVNNPTFAMDTVIAGDHEEIRTHDKGWSKFDSGWVAQAGLPTFAGTNWPSDGVYWPSSALTHFDGHSFTAAGSETVNGVATTHYTKSDPTTVNGSGWMSVTGSSRTEEVWIATAGGYPVRWKLTATGGGAVAGSCNSSDFQFLLDITKANDAGNVVVLPS